MLNRYINFLKFPPTVNGAQFRRLFLTRKSFALQRLAPLTSTFAHISILLSPLMTPTHSIFRTIPAAIVPASIGISITDVDDEFDFISTLYCVPPGMYPST